MLRIVQIYLCVPLILATIICTALTDKHESSRRLNEGRYAPVEQYPWTNYGEM